MKHINCHCDVGGVNTTQRCEHNARFEIKRFKAILDHFYSEDGFDEFCDLNTVQIMVGSAEYSAETYVAPDTWETIVTALTTLICHLIEVNELDKFPYYERMIDKYSAQLNIKRGNFVN